MTTYIVSGRRFANKTHAITFAQVLSCREDQSVDVNVEVEDAFGRRQRSWMCRMHPPNIKRTILSTKQLPILEEAIA